MKRIIIPLIAATLFAMSICAAEVTGEKKRHWAFQPPVRTTPPSVINTGWVRNPIDNFILARLEKEGIQPSPEADRTTLIRRLSLDLLGLPPAPQEVDAFINDQSPDAYDRLLDRLFSSPHYGERWGRHWLDQARYADSNGYSIDAPRSIWMYRDWVINAFNKGMPFDQFTIEQLAGDLLPGATADQKVATGFHRNTQINQEGGIDLEQFRVESVVDRVNTTGAVFLGLTIGCCQCHDHKYDPITQKEYYQLFAFLNNCDEPTLELPTPEQAREKERVQQRIALLEKQRKLLDPTTPDGLERWEAKLSPELRAKLPASIQTILMIPENGRDAKQKQTLTTAYRRHDMVRHVVAGLGQPFTPLTPFHFHAVGLRSGLEKQITDQKKKLPNIVSTMVVQERTKPRETHVMKGGDFTRKAELVSAGVPVVLHDLRFAATSRERSPTRLDFARWIVDPNNPLTARVTVNRYWQQFFGSGLVETDNDFGTQGTPPTHPGLLDWLALEFASPSPSSRTAVRGAPWSVKSIHRLIITSATYRQASRPRPELLSIDPRNKLLARQNRLRLEGEVVRDVALAASGLLSRKIGGPSVFPPQPEGVYAFTQVKREWKVSTGEDRYRRGMYTTFWRSAPHPSLMVFDAPDATTACTRRNRSNTPLQALTLLNDGAYFEIAQALAARIVTEAPPNDVERLKLVFRASLSRAPTAHESERLLAFVKSQQTEFARDLKEAKRYVAKDRPGKAPIAEVAVWTAVARVVLNLDEFITRE